MPVEEKDMLAGLDKGDPCAMAAPEAGAVEKDMEPPEKDPLDVRRPLDGPAAGPGDVEPVCCSLGLSESWP